MKTVLITGGTRGIGRATAKLFHENGYKVVITYNNSKDLAEKMFIEHGILYFKCDLADHTSIDKLISDLQRNGIVVDVLVNNAGISLPQKILIDTDLVDFDKVFNVNVRGAYYLTKNLILDMCSKNYGRIIFVSSMWGVSGGSCEVLYSASKSALIGMAKALAKELCYHNITVNTVSPGLIDTDMNNNLSVSDKDECIENIPLGRMGSPIEVGEAIYYLADKGSFITGEVININGGEII